MKKEVSVQGERDKFKSRFGFIMACVGSSVGMGNIWLFPYRTGQFGGFAFMVPFLICVVALGFCGVIGEMAFGRAMKTGPIGAFKKACQRRGLSFGGWLGVIPVLGALGIAIGYAVVIGWVIRFLFGAISGSMLSAPDKGAYFGEIAGAFGSVGWHIIAIIITFAIMSAGIASGIERLNKILMPLFFGLFIILAIFVSTIDGVGAGYEFLFKPDWSAIGNPKAWMYALGQAFFSLSLAGSGTIVYGSYLDKKTDVVFSAAMVAIFDLIAAMLAVLVILPAVFAFGADPTAGPPLIFIVLPDIFAKMPAGQLFAVVFFLAVFFAGITSLVNLFEAPIETLQERYGLNRRLSCALILAVGLVIGLFIEDGNIIGTWMDFFSIYMIPLGALIAGILFYWVCGKGFATEQIQFGHPKKISHFYENLGKYGYCGITLLVILLGSLFGGIS